MKISKSMGNLEIAKLFRAVAAAYALKEEDNKFRITAYERAADAVEHSSSEVKDLWDCGELGSLAGVGSAMTQHLDELFRKGRVKHFDQLFRGLPAAVFELMEIPGIGVKMAYKLCKALGINRTHGAVEKLERAAKRGKVRKVEGFGEESERNVLENIIQMRKRTTRILLPDAYRTAREVIDWLGETGGIKTAEPLGSLRRKASTVGDIDIAVFCERPAGVIKRFTQFPQVSQIIESGTESASIVVSRGIQVDLMVQPERRFGSLLQHFTGSKHHNIALRELALKRGVSLSEKGIKRGSTLKEFSTEEDFYGYLGMDWIPPELREDAGEIEAGISHKLPVLVELSEIKGDLHLHSSFNSEPSHDLGTSSMEDMIQKALTLKYQYVGFSEHNPSVSRHSESEIIDLVKTKRELIEKVNYSFANRGIFVFNGMEIDIKPDGSRALPDKALELLDYAIVSIHGSFGGEKTNQTERVIRAMSHEKVRIFGHPTARKLREREGVDLEWEKIFEFCHKQKKILEINSYPDRVDLPDVLVKGAVKSGVKLVINTDSHEVSAMDLMTYGTSVARRGWAEGSDIMNALKLADFKKELLNP